MISFPILVKAWVALFFRQVSRDPLLGRMSAGHLAEVKTLTDSGAAWKRWCLQAAAVPLPAFAADQFITLLSA